ncbi:MAG: hypothetical protein GY771_08645 [bacterium]|nr:hypothetical protein [bacterium]
MSCQCYDHQILDETVKVIGERFLEHGFFLRGPIPIPSKSRSLTLLSSPFAHKTSRFQLKLTLSKRILDLSAGENPKSIPEILSQCNVHSSVQIKFN